MDSIAKQETLSNVFVIIVEKETNSLLEWQFDLSATVFQSEEKQTGDLVCLSL